MYIQAKDSFSNISADNVLYILVNKKNYQLLTIAKIVYVSFHEVRSRYSLIKELARQKTVNNAFKVKPNHNQNEKPMFESDSSNNTVSKSIKNSQLTGKLDLL